MSKTIMNVGVVENTLNIYGHFYISVKELNKDEYKVSLTLRSDSRCFQVARFNYHVKDADRLDVLIENILADIKDRSIYKENNFIPF